MSETQSVCKHCHLPEAKHEEWHDRSVCPGTHNVFEPLSEPASTGEPPPITEMYLCETERLFLKPNQLYRFVIHPTCVRCQELELIGAARPSEPSEAQHRSGLAAYGTTLKVLAEMDKQAAATQPSAEPPPVVEYKNRFGVMAPDCAFGCDESQYDQRCNIHRPAAPQSVPGDAPKVEEIAATIYERAFDCQFKDCDGAERVLWLAVAENTLLVLRHYFPSASQNLGGNKMEYQLVADKLTRGDWRVEAINHAGEGECFITIFSGPDSEIRAKEYASWKNQ